MIRSALAAALLVAVLVGGFALGAIRTITDDDWPDIDE